MELSINENKVLLRTVDNVTYERYAIKTRFVNIGDDYIEFMKEYALPHMQEGDFISISEKIIALCQKRIIHRKDIHPGFWAKFLCKFVRVTPAGPGAGTPYKMQLIIMLCGLPRVLFAAACSAVTKLFGKKGVFYKVCGHDVDGIDGLIDYDISYKEYVDYGILNPENPNGVCNEIYEKLGIPCYDQELIETDCQQGRQDTAPEDLGDVHRAQAVKKDAAEATRVDGRRDGGNTHRGYQRNTKSRDQSAHGQRHLHLP